VRCPCLSPASAQTDLGCTEQDALKPVGSKKDVTVADFKAVMAGLTDTTPTKDIVNAFKVFDKDVSPPRTLNYGGINQRGVLTACVTSDSCRGGAERWLMQPR
jgi:hypothetical protein